MKKLMMLMALCSCAQANEPFEMRLITPLSNGVSMEQSLSPRPTGPVMRFESMAPTMQPRMPRVEAPRVPSVRPPRLQWTTP